MAEYNGVFDEAVGVPSYTAAEFSQFMEMLSLNVIADYENELEVTTGTGLQVKVDSGGAIMYGRFYIQDEAEDGGDPKLLSVDASSAGTSRIDRIVVEWSTITPTGIAKVVKGTETAGAPSAPALVDTATVWQLSLATALITVGTLTSVTDDRTMGGARYSIADLSIALGKLAALTASRALVTNASGEIVVSAVTAAELLFLDGVTSAIQTQITAAAAALPYCYVTRSALQNSGNLVLWDNEVSDTSSMHDNATNPERITVPNTGFYQVDVLLNVTNSGSTVAGNFQLKKDGSILTLARYLITGSDYAAVHISMVVSMTATNYLEVYSQSAFSGTYNLASSSYSQITVKQVR